MDYWRDKETCFVKTEKNHYGVGHTLSFIYHNLFEKKNNKSMHVKKWNKLKMLFFYSIKETSWYRTNELLLPTEEQCI